MFASTLDKFKTGLFMQNAEGTMFSHCCTGMIGVAAGYILAKATLPAATNITKFVITAIEKEFIVKELAKTSLANRIITVVIVFLGICAVLNLIFYRNFPNLFKSTPPSPQQVPQQQSQNMYYQPQNQYPHA